MGQSTNDVFPTATRLALLAMIPGLLEAAAAALPTDCRRRRGNSTRVLKTGRTHLQDAVPMTLGQEFGGFAANVAHAAKEVERSAKQLLELNLGSTARRYRASTPATTTPRPRVANLAVVYRSGGPARRSNRFRVTQSMGDVLGYSGALRRLAVEVGKIASDLRLLSMGPRAGIAEIQLPAVQPGSSIMPGKVNPSVPEMVNQVCFQVFGCDATILAAAEAGQLELNVMMPVIAWNAIHATRILRQAMQRAAGRAASPASRPTRRAAASCSIAAPRWRRRSVPYIGYAATADIAKTAVATGRRSARWCASAACCPTSKLDRILSAEAMTSPGVPGSDPRQARRQSMGDNRTTRGKTARSHRAGARRPRPRSTRSARSTAGCFRPEQLGMLEGPDRDAWQRPDQIMDKLLIAEGSVVADLGAGGGWFTIRLAGRVGPNGTVYAEDVQPQMIEAITRRDGAGRAEERQDGPRHVVRIPACPRPVDAVLIVDAYHEMEQPVVMLAQRRARR